MPDKAVNIFKCDTKRKSQAVSETSTGDGLTGTDQWRSLMRKFSQSQKKTCKNVPCELELMHRDRKQFPTGSSYTGTWDLLGMSGKGTYTFPHSGLIYEGEFDDGMFHGNGELRYPCGAVIKGKWRRGKLMQKTLVFDDGLEYDEDDWAYCKYPDRRYTIEYDKGLEPAGRTYMTANQPTVRFPDGYYECGEGLYDPVKKTVYKRDDITKIIRGPEQREQKWIIDNCRTMPEKPIGPCPFYETWQEPSLKAIRMPSRKCATKTGTLDAAVNVLLESPTEVVPHKISLASASDYNTPDSGPLIGNPTASEIPLIRGGRVFTSDRSPTFYKSRDFKDFKDKLSQYFIPNESTFYVQPKNVVDT